MLKNVKKGLSDGKKIILPSILALAVLTVLLSSQTVFASEQSNYPVIVERISEKFNLNKDEVNQVFNEVRDEHHADRYARWADKLSDLVISGELTEAKKDLILAKYQEMHDKRLDLVNLDPDERKSEMQKLHDELESWANENGIDLKLIGPFAGRMHRGIHFPDNTI